MFSFARLKRTAPVLVWLIALAAIPLWPSIDHAGWDVGIYQDAIHSLLNHHDPYADALALQAAYHPALAHYPDLRELFSYIRAPFSYIYPPVTLPLLKFFGVLPVPVAGALYWAIYAACALSILWVGFLAAKPGERQVFALIVPAVIFFPGLLQNDTILSGNVVIIFYGLVLTAAVLGWRTGRWRCCYLAILLASCFKLPLLTLLAIPLFSARKQLGRVAVTAATGLAIFAVQPFLWPTLFHEFLEAVGHQFSFIRDFGCSPAGLVSNFLFGIGIADPGVDLLVYLLYAVPLFIMLYDLSREFLRGRLTREQWSPVLLVGVVLLNPRIMQYDTLVLALPMGLIVWRALTRVTSTRRAAVILCVALAATSFCAVQSLELWRLTEGPLLVLVFAAGYWDLTLCLRAKKAIARELKLHEMPLQDRLAA